MLRVFDKNATDFSTNGLAVINAPNTKIEREINGEWKLSFPLSGNDSKWQYIKQRNKILCEGQQYRIYKKGQQKEGVIDRTVECLHVINDAADKFIPYFEPKIGQTPRSIMLSAFSGTAFNIMTDVEVDSLGMQWVEDLTDILEQSKINPMVIVKQLIENLGKGELYIDNYNVALVERIGKDTGLEHTLAHNLSKIGDEEDGNSIITRLYAYGKDDMPLPAAQAPGGYIDSPEGIAAFGVIGGHMDFDTIEDPAELLQKAQWQFSPDNPKRVDMPNQAYDINLIDLYKIYGNKFRVHLGDSIRIKSTPMSINTAQRIVKHTYYPYSPQSGSVTLGKPPKTYMDVLKNNNAAVGQYNKTILKNGKVRTAWMENLIGNLQQEVYAGLEKKLEIHKTGDLWEFGNDTAIAIVDGVLAIANERKPDGTWDFRTFGTGDGLTADALSANEIYTAKIVVTDGSTGVGNFADAGALATKDNVDISSGEVLNAGLLATLDSINGTYIDNNSITTPKLATGAVVTSKLAAGAVTANEINVANLSAITADLGTVTAGSLTSNTYIDVETDVSIGNKLYINSSNFGNGIRWVSSLPGGAGDPEIYIDPVSEAMFIEAQGDIELNTYGKVRYNGAQVATMDDIGAGITAKFA